ncbi:MAG: PorT family protein [Bacteroidetes bacterium]|nr:PorT family protein [Bacteroidota bacterium]
MRKFTTLLIFAFMLTLVTESYSQTFGIKGGLNLANLTVSGDGISASVKSIIGIHVGPVAYFRLQENLSFNTGLLFSIKGAKVEGTEGLTETLNYLVVPLNLAYKFPINESVKFFIQAGPYVGYAISGKDKYSDVTENVKFGEKGGLKRGDFGLGFGAGLGFGSIITSLNYELGLSNMIDDSNYKSKNKVLQLSVAYMFGGK